MVARQGWNRQQLLVAFALYCRLPFGKLHQRNPEIIRLAGAIGRSPSALAMKLTNIASLDPAITATGRSGLSGASAKDRELWQEMHADWPRFAIESQKALDAAEAARPESDGTDAETQDAHSGGERIVSATARIGQNFFRAAVLSAYNERCCISGLSLPALLVASHIVPWSHDQRHRVNPQNGLLLSALHDKAFDLGLITINDDLTVRVSENRPAPLDAFFQDSIMSYHGKPISLPEKFSPNPEFLAYHRQHIFQK